MKTLPDTPPHALRSSVRNRSCSFEIEVCSDIPRTGGAAEEGNTNDDLPWQGALNPRSFSYGDGGLCAGKSLRSEKPEISSSHHLKASPDLKDDDDDDDGMEWANSARPVQATFRSFHYGVCKGFHAGKGGSGKRNKVRISCKLAPLPSSIARQQHAGPIKPNSGPLSGPLKVTANPISAVKAHMAPSIIPVNLMCKRMLGFDLCEPTSPKVTCLGRIKINESHNVAHATTANNTHDAIPQKVEKGKCFDTKNHICGKRSKGRKKKKAVEKSRCLSRRRRFASKEATDSQHFSSSVSSEHGETRREKAASLAKSLTGLLEDVRRSEKDKSDYVPRVPPPNSLLLMRGYRVRDEICLPSRLSVDGATGNDVCSSLRVEALDEEGCIENLRDTAPLRLSLLHLIGMEDDEFSTSEVEDAVARRSTRHAKAISTSLSEKRENFEAEEHDDKKNESTMEVLPRPQAPRAALWQRRAISEPTSLTVKQRPKQKMKLYINK